MRSTLNSSIRLLLGVLICGLLLQAPAAKAAAGEPGGKFGLGAVIGDPTAITGKYFFDGRTKAIDGGLSFALSRWFLVYGDYLYHVNGAFGRQNEFIAHLTPYLGLGGLLVTSFKNDTDVRGEEYFSSSSSSHVALGARVPLGIEWRPATVPVGVFVELAPGITIFPGTYGFLQGGIGARFFF